MKKISLLVGMLALGVASLQASAMGAAKPGCPPKDPNTSKPTCAYGAMLDPDVSNTRVMVAYTGGFAAPMQMTIAQNGTYATAATTNEAQEWTNAKMAWNNGVTLELEHSTGNGHLFSGSFRYLMNDDSGVENKLDKTSSYTDASATSSTVPFTGASQQVTTATGHHKLKGLYDLRVFMSHLLCERDGMMIAGSFGGHYLNRDQEAYWEYTLLTDGEKQKNYQHEKGNGGGVVMMLDAVKKYDCFGFKGRYVSIAKGTSAEMTSQQESYTGLVTDGYTVNSTSSIPYVSFVQEVSLGAFWTREIQAGLVTAGINWEGSYEGDATRLWSSVSGPNSLNTQGMIGGLINASVSVVY